MDSYHDKTFIIHKFLFTMNGLEEIGQNVGKRRMILQRCALVFSQIILMYGEIGIILAIIDLLGTERITSSIIFKISDLFPISVVLIFGLSRAICLFMWRDKIKFIMQEFREMLYSEQDEVDPNVKKNIVNTALNSAHRNFSIYFFAAVTNCLSASLLPLLSMCYNLILHGVTEYKLPFDFWYPFDTQNFLIWFISLCSQVYTGLIITCSLLIGDCLFAYMMTHICISLKLLCQEIQFSFDPDSTDLEVSSKIERFVKKHNRIIRLRTIIQEIYSPIIFINFLGTSTSSCVVIFSLMFAPTTLMCKYALFCLSNALQIFMLCHYGDSIMEENSKVSLAVYSSPWTSLSGPSAIRYRRDIFTIMLASNRQLKITSFHTISLTINTFASILKSTLSYYTLLKTVYQKIGYKY